MLFRKLLRTFFKYKGQFLSMIVMVILGTGIFAGFNSEWYSIKYNTKSFYENTHFADYRVINEDGFSEEDLALISEIASVNEASRFTSFETKDKDNTIKINVSENKNVSSIMVVEGNEYDEMDTEGIWISKNYASHNNLVVGEDIRLTYLNKTISLRIKGIALSSECLINAPEGALMPSFATYGYAYISPKCLEKIVIDSIVSENNMLSDTMINELAEKMLCKMYYQIHIISDAEYKEIANEIDDKFNKSMQVISKDDVISYSEVKGEENEGKTMGMILPIVFLLIAVLIMVTTMNRITTNEKLQIGILKALGFKNRRILLHYTSYAIVVGIVGSSLGLLLGYGVAYFIINPNGAMGTFFELPKWTIVFPWFVYVGIILINLFLVLIVLLSTKKILKGTASESLRSYTPKKMRNLLIEKGKLFHKLSFGTRWNLRETFTHPIRTIMTIFGVFGCTLLLFASFGMLSTYNQFLDNYYNKSMNYQTKITLKDEVEPQMISDYQADYSSQLPIKINEKIYSLEVFGLDNGLYKLLDQNGNVIENVANDGVYVCRRIKDEYDLHENDTITIKLFDNQTYSLRIVGVISSLTNGVFMTSEYADSLGFNYKITYLYTNTLASDVIEDNNIVSIQSKAELINTFNSLTEVFYQMIIMLVIFSIILGFAVLFNLGIMSYLERYRELATLKVLGFKNKKIGRLLISQNTILTIVGIILGLPGGHLVLLFLLASLAADYEMVVCYKPYVFIITIIATLTVSILVSYLVSLKVKKINMVEALKTE